MTEMSNAGSGDNHYVLQLQRSSPLVEGDKLEEAESKSNPGENGINGPGIQLRAIGAPSNTEMLMTKTL